MCYSVLVEKEVDDLVKDYNLSYNKSRWQSIKDISKKEPNKYKFSDITNRVYPGYITKIISVVNNQSMIFPMRYSMPIPDYIPQKLAKGLSSFNARKDSLNKRFWKGAIGIHHGILISQGFFEWVRVSDLIRAKTVDLKSVETLFKKQIEKRKIKWIEDKKDDSKFKLSKAEKKEAVNRDVVIKFYPKTKEDLLIPVIFDVAKDDPMRLSGFALITDEPSSDIKEAGHDRMPIHLSKNNAKIWLREKKSVFSWMDFLGSQNIDFEHKLA